MTSTINQRDAVTVRRREERFYERGSRFERTAIEKLHSAAQAITSLSLSLVT